MLERTRRLSAALLVAFVLAGCIQPVSTSDLTKTAIGPNTVPGNPQSAAPTAAVGGSAPPTQTPLSAIERFIYDRGDTPTALQIWYDQPLSADRLQGFSYVGANGLPCAGFLLMALVNGVWQPNNGALVCAPAPDTQALAAVTFFATSDGQVYTVVFGRVEDATVSAISVVYNDGSNQGVTPFLGGYLLLKSGVVTATVITAINAQGNTVIANIPQSPV